MLPIHKMIKGGAGALIALLLITGTSGALPATSAAGQQLEGSWTMTVTFDDSLPPGFPPSFPVLHSFFPSGVVIEANPIPFFKGSGQGEWVRTGDREFRYTLQLFVLNADGSLMGIGRVRHFAKLKDNLTEMTGTFIGETFDVSGRQLVFSKGTFQGKRNEVDLTQPQ